MNIWGHYAGIAALGAGAVQILKLMAKWGEQTPDVLMKHMREPGAWVAMVLFLAASGVIGWGANAGNDQATVLTLILSGAGARELVGTATRVGIGGASGGADAGGSAPGAGAVLRTIA